MLKTYRFAFTPPHVSNVDAWLSECIMKTASSYKRIADKDDVAAPLSIISIENASQSKAASSCAAAPAKASDGSKDMSVVALPSAAARSIQLVKPKKAVDKSAKNALLALLQQAKKGK